METARKAKMTYFILRSAGTGQRFSLVVNREQGEPQREECTPNGYGFGVTSSPLACRSCRGHKKAQRTTAASTLQTGQCLLSRTCRVVQQDDRIVYLTQDGGEFEQMFNIPERNTAFLLLGKGTSITDAAMRRMAASNVMVAFAEREDRRCSVYATSLS